ncbi:MAG: SDR family oxidoreductase [Bacteroidota bacterium]|nr:SDR family oxidoreductase [Bacteroidota bacterium]
MMLLTGAGGFLSSYLLWYLQNSTDDIVCLYHNTGKESAEKIWNHLARFEKKTHSSFFERLIWVKGDITNGQFLDELMLEYQITKIYHTAGRVNFENRNRDEILTINVNGTTALVNAAMNNGVLRIAHVSSVAAIGRVDGEIATEENFIESMKFENPYTESKYLSEVEIYRAQAEGISTIIINPSIILGWGNWESGSAEIFNTVANGLKYYTAGGNAFVDARDVAKVLILLMDSNIEGQRFLSAGHNALFKDLFTTIAKELGVKSPYKLVGRNASMAVAFMAELKAKIFGGKVFISRELASNAQKVFQYSNAKFLNEFPDFTFRPLNESIKEIAEVYKSEHSTR